MSTTTKTTPAAAPKAAGIKKINLGGIAAPKEKKGADYPLLPDPDGDVSKLVQDIIAETRELEALTGSLDAKKAELRTLASGFYFDHLHGRHEIPSSIECKNCSDSVLVTFSSRYKTITDESGLIEAIGDDRTAQYFRQAFELKIDGDKLPPEQAENIITALQELLAENNAAEALSAKSVIKPTPDFHTARHTALTVEENRAVEMVCPIVAMVKTKGRKKE